MKTLENCDNLFGKISPQIQKRIKRRLQRSTDKRIYPEAQTHETPILSKLKHDIHRNLKKGVIKHE
jgi:hypothetical protein